MVLRICVLILEIKKDNADRKKVLPTRAKREAKQKAFTTSKKQRFPSRVRCGWFSKNALAGIG